MDQRRGPYKKCYIAMDPLLALHKSSFGKDRREYYHWTSDYSDIKYIWWISPTHAKEFIQMNDNLHPGLGYNEFGAVITSGNLGGKNEE
jgi:hypothetical protein